MFAEGRKRLCDVTQKLLKRSCFQEAAFLRLEEATSRSLPQGICLKEAALRKVLYGGCLQEAACKKLP